MNILCKSDTTSRFPFKIQSRRYIDYIYMPGKWSCNIWLKDIWSAILSKDENTDYSTTILTTFRVFWFSCQNIIFNAYGSIWSLDQFFKENPLVKSKMRIIFWIWARTCYLWYWCALLTIFILWGSIWRISYLSLLDLYIYSKDKWSADLRVILAIGYCIIHIFAYQSSNALLEISKG